MQAITYFWNVDMVSEIAKLFLMIAGLTLAVIISILLVPPLITFIVGSILWVVPMITFIVVALSKALFVAAIVASPLLSIWVKKTWK